MLDYLLQWGLPTSTGGVAGLQRLLLYLVGHAWLGFFFILQVGALLLVKGRADAYNAAAALRTFRPRPGAGASAALRRRQEVTFWL